MLKNIFRAIVSALKSIVRMAGRIAAAPFSALAGLFGRDDVSPPQVQTYVDEDDSPAPSKDLDIAYRELAIAVRTWAARSILAGQPAEIPARQVSKSVAAWLPGLSLDEAHALIDASESEVLSHLRSHTLIAGVRSVRPLDPATWPEVEAIFDHEPTSVIDEPASALSR